MMIKTTTTIIVKTLTMVNLYGSMHLVSEAEAEAIISKY